MALGNRSSYKGLEERGNEKERGFLFSRRVQLYFRETTQKSGPWYTLPGKMECRLVLCTVGSYLT